MSEQILEQEILPVQQEAENGGGACCCQERTKARSDKEYRDLVNRLNRIEGQIRGIRRMVEEGVYCTDILTQVAAANCAMNSFLDLGVTFITLI